MPLVWSVFIVSLMPSLVLKLVITVFLCALLGNRKIIFFVLLSALLIHNPYPRRELKAKVTSISDHSFVVREGIRSYKVYTPYQGTLDDVVLVKGSFVYDEISASDRSRGIIGVIRSVRQVTLLQEGRSLRSSLYRRLDGSELLRTIVFGIYHEDYTLIGSMAMQISGSLIVLGEVLRRFFDRKTIRSLERAYIVLYMLIFGVSFGALRLFLSRVALKRESQMLILLCLFPGCGLSLAFLFPFAIDLVRGLSSRFASVDRVFIMPLVIKILRNRLNLIEMLSFKFQRILCGCFFLLALLSILVPIEGFVYRLVSFYQSFYTIAFFRRFDLNGEVSLLLVLLTGVSYVFKRYRFSFAAWLLVFIAPLYPMSWRVTYLDVGQGDATLIQAPFNAHTILIDTGPPNAFNKLSWSLERFGVIWIDDLVLTHDDLDHVGNLSRLQSMSGRVVREKGDRVPFLELYLSDRMYGDDNNDSLLFSLKTKRSSHLFMGDAGIVVENDFIRAHPHLKIDVLKLGHHGSRTSTSEAFLASIQPRYGIISSRPSTYGHPHIEVMRSLYRFRVRAIQTHESGNIRFISGILFDYVLTDSFGFGIIR